MSTGHQLLPIEAWERELAKLHGYGSFMSCSGRLCHEAAEYNARYFYIRSGYQRIRTDRLCIHHAHAFAVKNRLFDGDPKGAA